MAYFAKNPMGRLEDRRAWFVGGCLTDLTKEEPSKYFPSMRDTNYSIGLIDEKTKEVKQDNSAILNLFIKASQDNNDEANVEKFTKLKEKAAEQERNNGL